jgi:hypothetical protein
MFKLKIKEMKKYIIITVALFINCILTVSAQNNNNPLLGHWQWVNGNTTFKVELFLIADGSIEGHYSLIETTNGLQTTIYSSNKDFGNGYFWGPCIYGSNTTSFKGIVTDNTINYPGYSHIDGNLQIEIIPSSGLGSIQAKWTVKYKSGLRLNTDLREFNIPTDIILTKVQ